MCVHTVSLRIVSTNAETEIEMNVHIVQIVEQLGKNDREINSITK